MEDAPAEAVAGEADPRRRHARMVTRIPGFRHFGPVSCAFARHVPRCSRPPAGGGESMAARLKATVPLTVSIGVLAFLATELALNFTFHWVTVQNGVFGAYGVPQSIQ